MTTKHTKTPWYISGSSEYGTVFGGPASRLIVPHPADDVKPKNWNGAEDTANRALIVRCVNAHDELVEALAALVRWMDESGLSATRPGGVEPFKYEGTEYSVVTDARAILAKVRA